MKQLWCPHTSVLVSYTLGGDILSALIIQEKLIQVTQVFIEINFLNKFLNPQGLFERTVLDVKFISSLISCAKLLNLSWILFPHL